MTDWPNDQLEALEACHLASQVFDMNVLEAAFVEDRSELKRKSLQVSLAIFELYQAIGKAKP